MNDEQKISGVKRAGQLAKVAALQTLAWVKDNPRKFIGIIFIVGVLLIARSFSRWESSKPVSLQTSQAKKPAVVIADQPTPQIAPVAKPSSAEPQVAKAASPAQPGTKQPAVQPPAQTWGLVMPPEKATTTSTYHGEQPLESGVTENIVTAGETKPSSETPPGLHVTPRRESIYYPTSSGDKGGFQPDIRWCRFKTANIIQCKGYATNKEATLETLTLRDSQATDDQGNTAFIGIGIGNQFRFSENGECGHGGWDARLITDAPTAFCVEFPDSDPHVQSVSLALYFYWQRDYPHYTWSNIPVNHD